MNDGYYFYASFRYQHYLFTLTCSRISLAHRGIDGYDSWRFVLAISWYFRILHGLAEVLRNLLASLDSHSAAACWGPQTVDGDATSSDDPAGSAIISTSWPIFSTRLVSLLRCTSSSWLFRGLGRPRLLSTAVPLPSRDSVIFILLHFVWERTTSGGWGVAQTHRGCAKDSWGGGSEEGGLCILPADRPGQYLVEGLRLDRESREDRYVGDLQEEIWWHVLPTLGEGETAGLALWIWSRRVVQSASMRSEFTLLSRYIFLLLFFYSCIYCITHAILFDLRSFNLFFLQI